MTLTVCLRRVHADGALAEERSEDNSRGGGDKKNKGNQRENYDLKP